MSLRKNLVSLLTIALMLYLAYNPAPIWAFGQWFSDLVTPMVMVPVG